MWTKQTSIKQWLSNEVLVTVTIIHTPNYPLQSILTEVSRDICSRTLNADDQIYVRNIKQIEKVKSFPELRK